AVVLVAATGGAAGAAVKGSRSSAKPPVTLTGKVKNKGSKTAKAGTVSIEVDDYYFSPTFVKAKPGQSLTVNLHNESKQQHTFSVPGQAVDIALNAGQKTQATVAVPSSGAVLFYCKLHGPGGTAGDFGMQGAVYTATKQTVVNPTTANPTLRVA